MLSNEQIISISMKRLGEKPIGYERLISLDRVLLNFEVVEEREEIPTNGGGSYIDEKTGEVGFMTLLEILEYEGEIENIDLKDVQTQKAS